MARTPRWAWRMVRSTLRSGASSAAMTWMSTPKRLACMPTGERTPCDIVDGVERRRGVEHDLARAVDRAATAVEQGLDVGRLDLVAADLDLDRGEPAAEAARAVARPDVVDGLAAHPLGLLDRFADRDLGRFHVGDEAALHAPALALAGAEDARAALLVQRADQCGDLGGADIEGADQQRRVMFGHQFAGSTVPAGGGVAPGGTRTIILPGTRRSKRIMSRPSRPPSCPSWRSASARGSRQRRSRAARRFHRWRSSSPSGGRRPSLPRRSAVSAWGRCRASC